MGGRKLHLVMVLLVLLSFSLSEAAPRLGRRNRKKVSFLGAVVGTATRVLINKVIKPKATKAPAVAIFLPPVAAYPNQQYYQPPLGGAPPLGFQTAQTFQPASGYPGGQFNQTGHFNQTNYGVPAYAPNSIFPAAPGTPVQYPPQPNGVQPVSPFAVITSTQAPPMKNSKSSASTFNFNSGCLGIMAITTYLVVTASHF